MLSEFCTRICRLLRAFVRRHGVRTRFRRHPTRSSYFRKTHKSLFILLMMNMDTTMAPDQPIIDKIPMYTSSESKDQPLAVTASRALTGPVIGSNGAIVFSR